MLALFVFLGIILLAIVAVAMIYNNLVSLKNRYLNAFSQIDIQLKRRHDLIPNLVEVTRAYLEHERETLQAVIEARNTAAASLNKAGSNPGDSALMQQLAQSENQLGSALGRLNVVMEAYPELKANQSVAQLFEELSSTEDRVSFARQHYNDEVMRYNTARQSFPTNILANNFGHTKDAALLEFADKAQLADAPKISLARS